jgi:methylated-DNA-[protein]-cysteine S-methyltransferase
MTALATDAGLAGLWFDAQAHHPGSLQAPVDPNHPHLRAAQRWLDAYWAESSKAAAPVPHKAPLGATPLDTPPLDLRGTPFQRAVWGALLSIAPGATSTYAVVAAAAGSPAAVRAAGAAIGRNPVSVIVPCHRVLGWDGSLTGYAGGLERKRALLVHEGAIPA